MDAITAFGSEVKVRLLNHWAQTPGSLADAARALGFPAQTVADNAAVLVRVGILTESPGEDRRSSHYSVDFQKRDELLAALKTYIDPTPRP